MKKLFHERLKELASYFEDSEGVFTLEDKDYSIGLYKREAEALVDEIEKYYIPRPRFEDGEPIEWLSEDIEWVNTDDSDCFDSWVFTSLDLNGIPCATTFSTVAARAVMTEGGFVKRKKQEPDTLEKIIEDMKAYSELTPLDDWIHRLSKLI